MNGCFDGASKSKNALHSAQRVDANWDGRVQNCSVLLEGLDDFLATLVPGHPVGEFVGSLLILCFCSNQNMGWVEQRVILVVFSFGLDLGISIYSYHWG